MKNIILVFFAIVCLSCNSKAQQKENSPTADLKVSKTNTEWKEILSPQQYQVLRKAGTERPFSSELNNVDQPGTFVCAGCGNELFKTEHKFESGTGWPSFDRPIEGSLDYGVDRKLGFARDELRCADCGGHWVMFLMTAPKKPPVKDIV